jgi:hypothetical protein
VTALAVVATVIVVHGTATLKAFDAAKDCKWGGSKQATTVGCTVYGTFTGRPGPAGAGYGWVWHIPLNTLGRTAGHGTERGTVALNFGGRGGLSLVLAGRQRLVGTATPTHATMRTTGTWTMSRGTKSLAGKHGRGTYVFTIVRTGSPTVFSRATLVLAGSIS